MDWFPPTPYQPGLDEEASIFLQGTLVTPLCHFYTKPLTTFRLPGQRQQQEGATGGRQGPNVIKLFLSVINESS
jgi:hypothetical protein